MFYQNLIAFFSIDCSLGVQSLLSNTFRKSSRKTSDRYSQRCAFCRHEEPSGFYVSRRSVSRPGETFRFSEGGRKPANQGFDRSERWQADESWTVRNATFKQSEPSAPLRATTTATAEESPSAASIAGSADDNKPAFRVCTVYAETQKGPS